MTVAVEPERWTLRGRYVRLLSINYDGKGLGFVEYRYERTSSNRGGMFRRVREEPVQRMPVEDFRRLFKPCR